PVFVPAASQVVGAGKLVHDVGDDAGLAVQSLPAADAVVPLVLQLSEGDEVVVVGLRSAARNGRCGHIAGRPDTAGRFAVQLRSGRVLMLCPTNTALPTSAVAIAALATIADAKASYVTRRWTLPPPP
ncbi:MAG: hypothetical protein ACKPKO_08330, partial [Candidatus Fonsibacter sp.]